VVSILRLQAGGLPSNKRAGPNAPFPVLVLKTVQGLIERAPLFINLWPEKGELILEGALELGEGNTQESHGPLAGLCFFEKSAGRTVYGPAVVS